VRSAVSDAVVRARVLQDEFAQLKFHQQYLTPTLRRARVRRVSCSVSVRLFTGILDGLSALTYRSAHSLLLHILQ